jgi:hypothetical protein
MASYTREASELLHKLAACDFGKLQSLHFRADCFCLWFLEKQDVQIARLMGDTPCFADLAAANVHLMQLVSRFLRSQFCRGVTKPGSGCKAALSVLLLVALQLLLLLLHMAFPSGPKASPVAASNVPLFVPLFPFRGGEQGNRGTGDELDLQLSHRSL